MLLIFVAVFAVVAQVARTTAYCAQSSGIEAEGVLASVSYSAEGRVLGTRRMGYRVQLRDSHWRLRFQELGSASKGPNNEGVMVLASDGTDIFSVVGFTEAEIKRSLTNSDPQTRALNNIADYASAYEGPYPIKEPYLTRLMWLAFCSGQLLATNNPRTMPYPGTRLATVVNLSYEWTPLDAMLKLPLEITFLRDSPGLSNKFPRFNPGSSNIAGIYRVLATTNIDDRVLPVEFEFLSYFGGDSAADMHLRNRIFSAVKHMGPMPGEDIGLPLPVTANVVDTRFTELFRPFVYVKSDDETWLDRKDPALLAKMKKLSPNSRPTSKSFGLLALFIVFLLLSPFLFVAIRRFRSSKTQEI